VKKFASEKKTKAAKSMGAAASSVEKFFKGAKFGAHILYEDTLRPLWEDTGIPEGESIRDALSPEEILRETKLQFERFSFWVMSGEAAAYDWKKDEAF